MVTAEFVAVFDGWSDARQCFARLFGGVWEWPFQVLIDKPGLEWLMIDGGCCKLRPHAAGGGGGSQGERRTKSPLGAGFYGLLAGFKK